MLSPFVAVRPAKPGMVAPLLAGMATSDRREMVALAGEYRVDEVLEAALAQCDYTFAYTIDDAPVAVGGMRHDGLFARVWMVAATPMLSRRKKDFLRASLAEVAELRRRAEGPIRTGVDERQRKSLLWLRWLGFEEIDEFEFQGRDGIVLELRA